MSEQPIELMPGQIWWDEHNVWTDGSPTLDFLHVLLSAEMQPNEKYLWRSSLFMWAGGGFCGGHERHYYEDEIRRMTYLQSLADIKSFNPT